MERGDILAVIFLIVLIFGLLYFYQNLDSFQCSIESSLNAVSNDISYEFEPQGSLYSKTKVFRFAITSSKSRLEYFGMKISRGEEVLFFENRTTPEGGSILSTINLTESDNITVDRFFKKRCYPEIHL